MVVMSIYDKREEKGAFERSKKVLNFRIMKC